MSTDAPALELDGVTKRFDRTEIIRGVTLAVPAGERHAIIGPNGAGKSTLFNLISGRFHATAGRIRLNGTDITQRKPFEINRLGTVAQLPDHEPVPPAERLREPALLGAVVARAPVRLLEEPEQARRCGRTRRGSPRARRPEAPARHPGGAAHVRRAARARDRHHDRRRRERHPARRAHGRHEPRREPARGRPDPRRDGRQDAADGRARHGRRVRAGRPDLGGRLRAGDRHRHAGRDPRQRGGQGSLPGHAGGARE